MLSFFVGTCKYHHVYLCDCLNQARYLPPLILLPSLHLYTQYQIYELFREQFIDQCGKTKGCKEGLKKPAQNQKLMIAVMYCSSATQVKNIRKKTDLNALERQFCSYQNCCTIQKIFSTKKI